jgi:hypothetical protein
MLARMLQDQFDQNPTDLSADEELARTLQQEFDNQTLVFYFHTSI